ncbi:ATP-dependent nuclease [Kitasatospora purpeofusca]|uniref:ATP-dependent nuclease n=1 Tax=Kitasatospora purpeofusca TaxID=67352 RepID=UPI0036A0621A
MHLKSFSVSGFRSLTDVADIPVSRPTILAGHNDGGKSAVLDALAFLLGKRSLSEDDRSYSGTDPEQEPCEGAGRMPSTSVTGVFLLDEWEQGAFGLPAEVKVRRWAALEASPRLQVWGPMPDDERLVDLSRHLVPALKELVAELGLAPLSQRRADLEAALRQYAAGHSTEGWGPAPVGFDKRMPAFLPFDGKAARPDDQIKTALSGRFQHHMADPELKGRLGAIELDVQERLRIDAKSLCEHIQDRCPDLAEVFVEPEVSFTQGFRGAPLRIARTAGEPVGLERSGLGSNRRVSLAIWEWNNELLIEEEITAAAEESADDGEPVAPPVQTIVVYDEPDTHLDYGHQRRIMNLIREQSALPHVSVMVATHSMNLIDGVDISDVVHLKLENHRTVVERLGAGVVGPGIDIHLGKIAAAVGLRNTVLLHERCFLAVEGDTEQRAFPVLFRLCEELSLQAAGIALWACFNNEGALHLARYLVEWDRAVMLVVDADSRNVSKSIFKEAKLTQFFGTSADRYVKFLGEPDQAAEGQERYNELEEIFTDPVWAKVANKAWPKEEGEWSASEFTALRIPGKKFSEQVKELLQIGSPKGPGGKPDMMYTLAATLDTPDDVPLQLRSVFSELRTLAG